MKELSKTFIDEIERISRSSTLLPRLYQVGETWLQPDWDFFSRTLTIELVNYGALQAFLWKDQFLYEYGFKLLSPPKIGKKLQSNHRLILREYLPRKLVATGSISKDGQTFSIYTSVMSPGNSDLIFLLVRPEKTSHNHSVWNRIVQLLESFGYGYRSRDNRVTNLFDEFSAYFLSLIQNKFRSGIQFGVVTHFYIQDLERYFHPLGLQKSLEILKSIQLILGSHVKNEDIFVHQNTFSYFVFSPQCKKEVVLQRFEQVFLQVHHLIVDYRMRFWEVDSYLDIENGWIEFMESPKTNVIL